MSLHTQITRMWLQIVKYPINASYHYYCWELPDILSLPERKSRTTVVKPNPLCLLENLLFLTS